MLTYEDFLALSKEVSQQISGRKLTRFELIKPRTYQLLFDGIPVLLSLQPGFVRFHLLSKALPTLLDPFSSFFQKKLQDKVCKTVFLLNEDRLLEFQFNDFRLIAALFPKKPNLYLVNKDGMIESSLYPIKDPLFAPPVKPERKTSASPSTITSAQLEFQFAQQEALQQLKHALDRAKQTERSVKAQLEKCQSWEALHHEGLLLQSHFHLIKPGTTSIALEDWESGQNKILSLDATLSPHENIAERFKLAKRQQEGVAQLTEALEKHQKKIEQLEEKLKQLSEASSIMELPAPKVKPVKAAPPKKGLPYVEFLSQSGVPIWVGKGAAKNDILTFRHAKGNDWWLHVQGFPGSHVVIRTSKDQAPDEETLQDAIVLAIAHSKAKDEKYVEVLVTQRKFVSKLGKTGQVQVSKHKLLNSHADPKRLERLNKGGRS